MTYILVSINAIVVALMAVYVHVNERRFHEISYHDRTVQYIENVVKNLTVSISNEIRRISDERIAEKENVDKPAFFAFLKSDVTSSGREVVRFYDVKINKGNHYNPTTGIFTAPRQGIYQISCTIVGYALNAFYYQITLNGIPYTLGNASSGGSWNSQTSTVFMDLKQGDQVYVEHRESISQIVHANTNSYFSGYLLQ